MCSKETRHSRRKFLFGLTEAFKEKKGIQAEKRHLKREEAIWEGRGSQGGKRHSRREICGEKKQGILGRKFFGLKEAYKKERGIQGGKRHSHIGKENLLIKYLKENSSPFHHDK